MYHKSVYWILKVALAVLLISFAGKPILSFYAHFSDEQLEFAELFDEEDSEKETEKEADEVDVIINVIHKMRSCQSSLIKSSYYQLIHTYSEYDPTVLLQPPRFV
jgi:hypothetical protein